MSQEHVDAARRCLEGWNRGDIEAWLEPAHPEVEWSSAIVRQMEGAETVTRGHAGLRRFWDDWHAVWDTKLNISEIRDLGETVVVLGEMQIRGEASGVDIERPTAWVFEFEAGLTRRVRAYLDWQEALEAVGVPSDP